MPRRLWHFHPRDRRKLKRGSSKGAVFTRSTVLPPATMGAPGHVSPRAWTRWHRHTDRDPVYIVDKTRTHSGRLARKCDGLCQTPDTHGRGRTESKRLKAGDNARHVPWPRSRPSRSHFCAHIMTRDASCIMTLTDRLAIPLAAEWMTSGFPPLLLGVVQTAVLNQCAAKGYSRAQRARGREGERARGCRPLRMPSCSLRLVRLTCTGTVTSPS